MSTMAIAARAAEVWRGLSQDERFQAVYGSDPLPIWINAIALLTDEQCKHGVEVCNKIADSSPFPVNLTEFEAAARSLGGQPRTVTGYNSRTTTATVARPEVRDRHLANIRARLAK